MDTKSYIALVWEKGKKDTRAYYQDRKAWTYNIFSSLLIAIISPVVYIGMGLIMSSQFWVSVLAGLVSGAIFFFLWRGGVFAYHLIQAPMMLLQEKGDEVKKAIEDKDFELEKYNWENVVFWVAPYNIIGMSGWVFRIENRKRFALENVTVRITAFRKEQEVITFSSKHILGHIDTSKGEIGEKIINTSKGVEIKTGEEKDFVVNRVIHAETTESHVFVTYPDNKDLEWPFPANTRQGGVFGSFNKSLMAFASAYAATAPPPESMAVIQVKITCDIRIDDDETMTLPIKAINVQLNRSGSLSFYNNLKRGRK